MQKNVIILRSLTFEWAIGSVKKASPPLPSFEKGDEEEKKKTKCNTHKTGVAIDVSSLIVILSRSASISSSSVL